MTEAMIETATAKADYRVSVGTPRGVVLPDSLHGTRRTCTAKGRCKVGWIVSRGGRECWDVWLTVATGLVKLVQKAEA